MTDKNIRDFERLISTSVVPESARFIKSMDRFRRDVDAVQKAFMTAAAAAPDSHKVYAAHLIQYAEGLGAIAREFSASEAGVKGIPSMLSASCDDMN
jgi:hypothetical protein